MKEVFKGVIFYTDTTDLGCFRCLNPGGCFLIPGEVVCVWCYKGEKTQLCFSCSGIEPDLPIYWVCGWHYALRQEACPFFTPKPEVLEKVSAALDADVRIKEAFEDKKLLGEIIDEIKKHFDLERLEKL